MGKFNINPNIEKEILDNASLTVNEENGIAFQAEPKTELTLRVLTWLVNEPKFYNKPNENQEINELIKTVALSDPEYLMKLAVYARTEMYLRSAPIYLLVESAKHESVKPYIRKYTPKTVSRADEITETLALYISNNGGTSKLPNSLKKGLSDAIHNFNDYQLAKYNRKGKVKLRDVLRIVHPKPKNDKESALFGLQRLCSD